MFLFQKKYFIGCIVIISIFANGCANLQRSQDSDMAAINDLWKKYETSQNTRDMQLARTLWTDDAIKMTPYITPLVGMDAIFIRSDAAALSTTTRIKIKVEETVFYGDQAYCRGTYVTYQKVEPAGQTMKYL
jgi:ketosteroid isomerase-like protein